ncbi:MAG TPA: hypothetical protein VJZ32_11615 [Candidatus Bathyarchaeia archaeon]|nr:hypothetical protein [Candidatus Bathyarchaeia archaeon]
MRRFNGKFSLLLIASILIVLMTSTAPASAQLGVWRDINPTSYISPPANPQLNSVYMFNRGFDPQCEGTTECGWAVGDSRPTTNTTTGLPAIFHYDGQTWNFVPAPQFMGFPTVPVAYNLTAVTFGPPNNPISPSDGWAVGFTNFTFNIPIPAPTAGPPTPPSINQCAFVNPTLGPNLGCTALAIHWDGVGWRLQTAGLTGINAGPLWDAFMVGPTDVWAVGENTAGNAGVFWHWTGVPGLGGGWNMPQAPIPGVIFYSIFMVSSTEGWAIGSGGAIWHYTGGAWSAFTSPASGITTCGTESSGVSLRSIFMISPTEGWAVGDCGTIIQYISGTWNGPVSPGTTSFNLLSVFMVSSNEGWAFGQRGTIIHYSGGSWSLLSSNLVPTSPVGAMNFNSAYFNTPSDGWGVGTDGVIMHFDGTNYGTVTSPTINNFTSISFGPPLTGPIDPNDGWAVGNASAPSPIVPAPGANTLEPTVYHWNGFVWTKGVSVGTTNNLNSVFMVDSGDVWTVGGGIQHTASCTLIDCPVILHFTGGSWNTITPPPGAYVLKSIFMVSSNEGWAVGEQAGTCTSPTVCTTLPSGIILHYTVSGGVGTWAVFPSPSSPTPTPPLNSVFMLSADNGWAVGDNATILQYTVSGGVGTWNPIAISGSPTLSTDANLTSIFMLNPTTGWIVGGIQNGCNPLEPCAAVGNPTGLPSPPAEIENPQGAATGPVSLYWDGTKWEPVPMPPLPGKIASTGIESGTLKSVFFSNPNDGWTVGLPGKLTASIYHWDGTSWRVVVLSPPLIGQIPGQVPPVLSSVYMTSEGNGWIVGGDPGITGSSYTTWPPVSLNPPPNSPQPNCLTGNVLTPGPPVITSSCPAILADPLPFTGKPLSAILQFSAFGGEYYSNSTSVIVSTVTTQYTAASTSTTIIHTFSTNSTITIPVNATTSAGHPGIPGFTAESIIAGISVGLLTLIVLRRRRFRGSK